MRKVSKACSLTLASFIALAAMSLSSATAAPSLPFPVIKAASPASNVGLVYSSSSFGYDQGTGGGDASMGTVRLWDTSTSWCDLQPTADTDLTASFDLKLKPHLDEAVKAHATRVIIVTGHPAPWVFGNSDASKSKTGRWYCDGAKSGDLLPSVSSFNDLTHAGPRVFYVSYLSSLMNYISTRYPNKFQTWFQSSNELNFELQIDPKAPGTAKSDKEAGTVLANYDFVERWVVDKVFPGRGFHVLASTFAVGLPQWGGLYYSHPNMVWGYLHTLDASSTRAVEALAENSYSSGLKMRTKVSAMSDAEKDAVTTLWKKAAQGYLNASRGVGLVHPPSGAKKGFVGTLRNTPVWQTETNQNLINNWDNKTNLFIPASDRQYLAARTIFDGVQSGLATQVFYSWVGVHPQQTIQLYAGSPSVATISFISQKLNGLSSLGCSSAGGGTQHVCSFINPKTHAVRVRLIWMPKLVGKLAPIVAIPPGGHVYLATTGALAPLSSDRTGRTPLLVTYH